jgi:F-type H+-transporting ATPase subunit b
VLTLFTLVLVAAPVWAAEGASEDPVQTPLGWAFRILNAVLVFAGLGYLIFKKAPAFFRGRADRIAGAITDSTKAKAEADRKLRESEEKLARLDQQVAEMRASAQHDAAAEFDRIRTTARDEATKIERAAQAEIAAAERAARMELKALAARLAVQRAEAMLRGQIDAGAQSRLVQSFVQQLGAN